MAHHTNINRSENHSQHADLGMCCGSRPPNGTRGYLEDVLGAAQPHVLEVGGGRAGLLANQLQMSKRGWLSVQRNTAQCRQVCKGG